ncbi:uncharacterized protein LOC126336855 isoform X1 [Schistocerca gregaria]|uniref:uncharacterized protein LOC126336855 isoform X1 n=1 Tax=Schistocerca gregaria TaxID=7010 RepID=UPI00211E841A|nr:uncharacterized protein LOC126336855 isoform X1 [Schistocerca gregaria]XP_049856906.1 uncharacterized protein LOC126336855 isoform X1 [Schistocerca gregaria]
MALVMLPCDLPWWPTVQRHLTQLALARTPQELVDGMQKIHTMCNISLDPDEEGTDDGLFEGLKTFLEEDLSIEEQNHFLGTTAPAMVQRALQLKQLKPPSGLHFSLQQQADRVELDRNFVASLLAHAFFSTFPKRTSKTHPTLQDSNFTHFFKHLNKTSQKAKLKSILHYFDSLEGNGVPEGNMIFSRMVMTSKEWLTIEDWLECGVPLIPVVTKHEGRLERSEPETLQVCFSSSHLGGDVLHAGSSQESIQFCTQPELLALLSFVEALEDNEVVTIDGVQQVSRIHDPKHRSTFETASQPRMAHVCCMDAENYKLLPVGQFEEDNVLRELNKALLGFRQLPYKDTQQSTRRLSPIGESCSSTPPETTSEKLQKQETAVPQPPPTAPSAASKDLLRPPSPGSRRGRFIVLGSSGECLPITRNVPLTFGSHYSSCQSETESEEFHSACTSLDTDDTESEGCARRYSSHLDTPERRHTFAARLRDALCREAASSTCSTDSSYAVGISVTGSSVGDKDIRVRRGGSRGFMLQEDSMDDKFFRESLQQEKEWIDKFRAKRAGLLARKDTGDSSKYSFSTDCSSEIEELYEQYSRWLEDAGVPENIDEIRELDARDIAVVRFAGSLLKRTLSDSFAGVSLTEGAQGIPLEGSRAKLAIVARSLSLELARHKHKLAAQLASVLGKVAASNSASGIRAVSTGNWGCGSSKCGDPQLKLVIQWLAASMAGVPCLHYYTCANDNLLKLDTVVRVLLDRHWTVGELAAATLQYAEALLDKHHAVHPTSSLFDELIGVDKPHTSQETNL